MVLVDFALNFPSFFTFMFNFKYNTFAFTAIGWTIFALVHSLV